jgi:undecaprenyl diphosphate synthase
MNTHVPKHVVIIPDGNRRWAKKHLLTPWQGHEAGFQRVKELCTTLREAGVKYCTLWGFSTENWNRSKQEVKKLMNIFVQALKDLEADLHMYKIRFTHIGRTDRLPNTLCTLLQELQERTSTYTAQYFTIALDYGGRDEIVRAVNALKNSSEPVTEQSITEHLDTKDVPDPDFIIRTSGECA